MFRGEVVDYAGTFWQRPDFNVAEKSLSRTITEEHGGGLHSENLSTGIETMKPSPVRFLPQQLTLATLATANFLTRGHTFHDPQSA
jgi:hypothetical protein